MLKQLFVFAMMVFVVGWLSHAYFSSLAMVEAMPVQDNTESAATQLKTTYSIVESREKPSPADRLKLGDVHVTDNRVIIDGIAGRKFETAIFTDTNSMDPLIDDGSQAIQIVPLTPDEIQVGDIISYDAGSYGIIIHRVIQIGTDENGWYAIVKGDNNPAPDPIKVRFKMIKRVLVGVLY
ncbi:MAG: signal peptidase I [Candidatus Woesearchaeota archaeon]